MVVDTLAPIDYSGPMTNTHEASPFITRLLDALDSEVEASREWSPVPAEYQGMGHEDVQEDLNEFYSEQALAEWEMNLLYNSDQERGL